MTEGLDETLDGGVVKSTELTAGTHLGKYRLERVLGSGGMGVVWAAHDPDLERRVAIKVLRRADAGPALRTRLLREARAMARLKHPNVLTVYEVSSDGDRDFIAMELVDGASVDAWLDARPPADEIWQAVMAAGRGLAAAHAAGLVHRDFKPHNVLRSKDGRILVTDFGLARGSGEDGPAIALDTTIDVALDATVTPRQTDNVLDSTLTQPGQLIGTPAYMAPEQYDGAAPDPRTDQFAFCVTAWQAMTGERPFDGKNIEELRRAAKAGVAGVRTKMPRGVRAVLARGLSADPAARWPDLEALLVALERDVRRRKIIDAVIWSVCGTILLIGLLTGIQLLIHRGGAKATVETKPASGCAAPDVEFAEAWTPERRAALDKRFAGSAGFKRVADLFDTLRTDWIAAYGKACTGDKSTAALVRQSCLLGERDEVATYSRLLETIPPSAIDALDLGWGILPRVQACGGPSPVAPPLLPEDRKQRDQIVALRVQLAMLRLGAPDQLMKELDKMLGQARWLGWAPLEAEVEESAGVAAQLVEDFASARTHLAKAADLAAQNHDYRVEATARIALLEVEMSSSGKPGEPGRATRLAEQAMTAVRSAGNDPVLGLSVSMLDARLELDRLQLDEAIDDFDSAFLRAMPLAAFRQANIASANIIDARMRRNRGDDLAEAWKLGVEDEKTLSTIPAPHHHDPLAHSMAELAWRRGDLDEAHARFDKLRHPLAPSGATTVTGKIVKADGTPAAGATVVAWHGELAADAKRVYIRGDFEGDVATADAAGAFTIHVPPAGVVIAELGGSRSVPVRAGDKPLAITIAPTRTLTGHVKTDVAGGIDVAVAFELGDASWSVATALRADGSYELSGVPQTGGMLGAERDGRTISAGAPRDHVELTWPKGPTIDIIARGTKGATDIYVLRGRHDVKTRAAVLALARSATDVAIVPAVIIGLANETEVGAHQYQVGDVHALVRDAAPGDVTACAVADDKVSCSTAIVPTSNGLAMTIIQR